MKNARFLIVAGEVSGDKHGSRLVKELKKRGDFHISVLGGKNMAKYADHLEEDLVSRSVVGFFEVVKFLPYFKSLKSRINRKYFSEKSPDRIDALVLIDYPGFNIRLAKDASAQGIPVYYYITPQVWAWGAKRAALLAKICKKIFCVFEFEKDFFEQEGGNAEFVGHPLLESLPEKPDIKQLNLDVCLNSSEPVLALLPGSRVKEIERHLKIMLAASDGTGLVPVVARPQHIPAEFYRKIAGEDIRMTTDSYALLARASVALVKSGTSTFDAAVAGVPFATIYRVFPLTYVMAIRLIKIPYISMVNILAGEELVPELIQSDFNENKLRETIFKVMDSSEKIKKDFVQIRKKLGGPGASARTAEAIILSLKEEL